MPSVKADRFPLGNRVRIEDLARAPYPILAELRCHEPVSWAGALEMWLVTGYENVTGVLRAPATFTTDSVHSTIRDTFGSQVLSTDGADHRRYKRACQPPFSASAVEPEWGEGVLRICDTLLDDLEEQSRAKGHFEFMAGLAAPLSLHTMGLVLGIDESALPRLRSHYDSFARSLQNFSRDPEIRDRAQTDAERMRGELASLLSTAAKSGEQRTLPERLAGDDGRELSSEESINNLLIVLFGGIETTESMIGNTVWALIQHPEILAEIEHEAVEGGHDLLDAAIEEALRWEPAVQSCTRHAIGTTEIDGVEIAKGETVQCMIGAANRDPEAFPDPDRFMPNRFAARSASSRHLSFGLASHFCLGAWLARLETRVAVQGLLKRFPGVVAAPGNTDAPYGHEFRKPPELWLAAS